MNTGYSENDSNSTLLAFKLAKAKSVGRKLQQILWYGDLNLKADSLGFSLAYALFLRAERTFASIQTLARLRLVDDAYALVRTMAEKIINAKFILLKGDDAALDYIEYLPYREWIDVLAFMKSDIRVTNFWTEGERNEMRKAHNEVRTAALPDGSQRKRYGRGSDWLEIGLLRRAQLIDDLLSVKFSSQIFLSAQTLYHLTYPKSSAYLHGTWESLARSVVHKEAIPDGDGYVRATIQIQLKDESPGVAIEALSTSIAAALEIILFTAKVIGNQRDLRWARTFISSYCAEEKALKQRL